MSTPKETGPSAGHAEALTRTDQDQHTSHVAPLSSGRARRRAIRATLPPRKGIDPTDPATLPAGGAR